MLHYQYEHLLDHITCCFEHNHEKRLSRVPGSTAPALRKDLAARTACCLDHCQNLLKMFDRINETFQVRETI